MTPEAKELVERLRAVSEHCKQLDAPYAASVADDAADLITQQDARIAELERERDEARQLVAEANNSLYGSQGYFHSSNGGPFDKYHLATAIEKLKESGRGNWRRAEAAEARVAELEAAVRGLLSNPDKASRALARSALGGKNA